MSYVGDPFAHDVFVTYSHADAEGVGESRLKAWSQGFIRELEAELRVNPKLARDLRLFFDDHHRPAQGLDPMSGLTDQLRADVAGSALLAVLMTPQYLGSRWCATEREWWSEAQAGHSLPIDGRVAVVRVLATAEAWPKPLVDAAGEQLTGYWLYDRALPEMSQRPFAWPVPDQASGNPFRAVIVDLAGWLALKLEGLKQLVDERHRAAAEAAKLAAPGGQTIYLHGRAEQAAAWERAADVLSQHGFQVTPNEPDPVEQEPDKLQRISRYRVDALTSCDALLLVGAGETRAVDADIVVVGKYDRHSARARSNRLLPCALLDTVGQGLATPRRLASARAVQVDWLDGTSDPWLPRVQGWLAGSSTKLEREGGAPAAVAPGATVATVVSRPVAPAAAPESRP
jgi:hypothetical protein